MSDTRRTITRHAQVVEPQPEVLPALGRHWLVIVTLALAGAFVGAVYASSQPVVFEAQSTLLLIAAGDETSPGGGRDRTLDVDTWASVARSTELLTEVSERLDLGLQDVRRRSTAVASPTGDVLTITFEAGDEVEAVTGATVYSELFLETRQTTVNAATVELQSQLRQLASDIEDQIQRFADDIDAEESKGDDASTGRLTVLINAQQRATERLSEVSAELATLDTDEQTGRVLIDPSTSVSRAGLGLTVIMVSGFALGALLGVIGALLKDRYDDRYGSVVSPEQRGIREIGRVQYVDPGHRRRIDARSYERLAAKLAFVRRAETDRGRSVLLLPVDRRTVPEDAAIAIALALESSASGGAVSVGVWSQEGRAGRRDAYRQAVQASLDELCSVVDLAVVPSEPLDVSSYGLGLSGLVDRVVLVISESTPMRLIDEALDDLAGVDAPAEDVIVLTSIRRRHVSAAAGRHRTSAPPKQLTSGGQAGDARASTSAVDVGN